MLLGATSTDLSQQFVFQLVHVLHVTGTRTPATRHPHPTHPMTGFAAMTATQVATDTARLSAMSGLDTPAWPQYPGCITRLDTPRRPKPPKRAFTGASTRPLPPESQRHGPLDGLPAVLLVSYKHLSCVSHALLGLPHDFIYPTSVCAMMLFTQYGLRHDEIYRFCVCWIMVYKQCVLPHDAILTGAPAWMVIARRQGYFGFHHDAI